MAGYLTNHWARQVDERAIKEFGMCGLVLMENAGRGCADLLERLGIAGLVAICCGRGNNAGDGFVLARHLELRGYPVRVLLWSDPGRLRGDAAVNFEILRHAETPVVLCGEQTDAGWIRQQLEGADWVADALLGTGAQGPPRSPFDQVIDAINRSSAKKLAIDLPSGLDCDLGKPAESTFRADHTATFVARKAGFQVASAQPCLGIVHVVDIGVPRKLVEEILTACGEP